MDRIKINSINPFSDNEWQEFLACGRNIRKRNSGNIFQLWKDDTHNGHLSKYNTSAWVAENGISEGRLLAYVNQETATGFIGWYECDNDEDLNIALFNKALDWFVKNSCSEIIGPINGSTWHQYRFNLTCKKPLFPGEPFQPKYYIRFWEKAGFEKKLYYQSTCANAEGSATISLSAVTKIFDNMGLTITPFGNNVYQRNKSKLHDFLLESFKHNPLFSPINFNEFCSIYDALPNAIPTGFSFILFNKNKFPIGMMIAYPEPYFKIYNKMGSNNDGISTSPKLIVKTAAVHPDWQGRRITFLFLKLLNEIAKNNGIGHIVHAMMYRENISLGISKRLFNTDLIREYALFERKL